jgi:hypothetical protein
MKPENRQKFLLIAAACVVGIYLLDTLVVEPLTASWVDRSKAIKKLRDDIENGKKVLARDAITRTKWGDYEKKALPEDPAVAENDLLGAFITWSKDSGVTITSTKPQWKHGATPEYSLLECHVDAEGSLPTITRFLYELEHSPMALRVESVELTSRDTEGGKVGLGLLVTGLRLKPMEEKQR